MIQRLIGEATNILVFHHKRSTALNRFAIMVLFAGFARQCQEFRKSLPLSYPWDFVE